MLHICTCSLSFINHFAKNAWHVTIHYLMNRNRFEKIRESGHRIGIAKFLTVHTGYIDKNKKISFSNILHISQRYAWQATIIFIYSIIDCLCVFVEFCRNSVSTSFKIKPSLTAIFSIRMIYF